MKKYVNEEKRVKSQVKINKKYLVFAIVVVLIATVSMVVYGYLTHQTNVTNTIKLGYNTISIDEEFTPPLSMDKNISFTKKPSIVNTGNVDCYVRVKSVVSDSRIEEDLEIDYNTEDYTYNPADGYWYYNSALQPNEKTTPLFTTVYVKQDASDLVLDGFDIYVYAESIQTVSGKTMQQVWNN